MSKKIIALVLFVAMLVAMVPVASAQNYTGTYPTVQVISDGWYAGQNVEDLDTTDNATDEIATDTEFTLGERLLNGSLTDGLTVEVDDKKTNTAGAEVSQNINITGSYSELQPYYYSYLAQNGVMGFAVKIPVRIGVKAVGANTTTNVSNAAYISGAAGYMNTYANASTEVAYITVVLGEADGTYTYKVWYGNSEQYTITVAWDNTDNDVAKAKETAVPTLSVVGVAGDQKDNFRADFTQAYWKKTDNTWYYYPGVLKFDIAAMTEADRVAILEAGNNTMTIKVKALDKNGYPYPQGTIVTFQGATNQNLYLGSSDKFVTVQGTASYLIDSQSTFNMTFSGVQNFAWIAGTGDLTAATWGMGSIPATTVENYEKNLDNGNVYLYTLVSGTLTANGTSSASTAKYTKVDGSYVVRFAYGNTAEELGFTLKYQNVTRTKSGITLLNDVVTVKVGETVGIAWIIDDPMAMYQGVKTGWTVVNEKIATAANGTDTPADANTLMVKGVKVGTTYAYAEDQAGEIELVVINVVPADFVATPEVEETVVGTKYVVTASKLNVREGAGTSFDKIRQLKRNTIVWGTEVEGSVWVKLNDGGYVHGKYLAEVE